MTLYRSVLLACSSEFDGVSPSPLSRLCKKRLDECKGNPDEHIMKLTKVFNYVVKLVVASRQLDVIQPRPSCDEKTFKTSMKEVGHQC